MPVAASPTVAPGAGRQRAWLTALLVVVLAGFAFLVVYTAWLSDDSYITLRTIDNWRHGFGLRWNVAERVQAYTHPLWMLLLAGAWTITGEPYFSSLALSITCSVAAVAAVALGVAPTKGRAVLAVALLAVSRAFVDYSTSGLENPLTHLLLVLFVVAYWSNDPTRHRVLAATAAAGLAIVNRLDLSVLLAPALLHMALGGGRRGWVQMALGMLPLVAWEGFSVVYYGFPFPNTAYAKLPCNVPVQELVPQGLEYLANSWRTDPVVLAALASAIAITIAGNLEARRLTLAAGIGLYLLYVVRVGGDFMSGRFLTAPYLLAIALLATAPLVSWRSPAAATSVLLLVLGSATGLPASLSMVGDGRADRLIGADGISDERNIYSPETRLLPALTAGVTPAPALERTARSHARAGENVMIGELAGFYGFGAGPQVYIIDRFGLGDPLMARLPALYPWRVGHYGRAIPAGYRETVRGGTVAITDPRLADYYRRLALIMRGPLWSRERWKAILEFNLGKYRAGWRGPYAYER